MEVDIYSVKAKSQATTMTTKKDQSCMILS